MNTSTISSSDADSAECWDSIAFLESAFHHGFMRSRLRNGEFGYHESPRLTRELDEFCDVDAMHQPKGPIILLGESGVGKSAFLANWLVRRKKMFQNWQTSYPEFIFHHVVGCSRQSCLVSNLLERILREIKEYFELTKDIPDVEERLAWQFPRFLEAASKKGRVILIIDGLQRLRTSGGESILKWVPLAFPPNVRIVFSGTINSPAVHPAPVAPGAPKADAAGTPTNMGANATDAAAVDTTDYALGGSSEHHERANLNAQMIERIKLEANRRHWVSVHVPPLTEDDRRSIVKRFLVKHDVKSHATAVLSASASERTHLHNTASSATTATGANATRVGGLQLFEIQEKAIVALPMTSNPRFLTLFLACLAFATGEGFNVHALFEQWLSAESVGQLLEAILRTIETGYRPDPQSTDDARQFLVENNYYAGFQSQGQQQQQHIGGLLNQMPAAKRKVSTTIVASAFDTPTISAALQGNGASGSSEAATARRGSVNTIVVPSTPSTQTYGYHDARLSSASAFAAVAAAEVGMRHENDGSNDTTDAQNSSNGEHDTMNGARAAPLGGITRMGSAHEMKEMFVQTLRATEANRSHALASLDEFAAASSASSSAGGTGVSATTAAATTAAAGLRVSLVAPLLPHKLAQDMHPHYSQSVRLPSTHAALARASISATATSLPIEPPAYLTGGRDVAPLSELLGRALCLLYVCRHGLLTNELRFILNAIVTEERDAAAATTHVLQPRKSSFSNVKHVDAQRCTAFSEHAWLTLLRAMKPLGVLFVQDVVVLPLCSEVLREVVWWRYIGSERCEQQYHQWLIRFFRIHPTTFRRVEELPWHLQRCYQWDALRSVLVNLPMFQLLYTATFKHELFGYWRTLTDGPLLIYNSSSKSDSSSTDTSREAPVFAKPFDVVTEYSKSVDEWYKSARPPTKVFTPLVVLVTKFMYEFSLAYQGCLPVFNYAPLELVRLFHDGFCFVEDLPHVQLASTTSSLSSTTGASSSSTSSALLPTAATAAASPSSSLSMAATAAATATTALLSALDAFATLGQSGSGASSEGPNAYAMRDTVNDRDASGNWFFFYQRWVWIHVPWLALSNEIVIREPFVSPNGITRSNATSADGGSTSASLLAAAGGASNTSSALAGTELLDGDDDEVHRESSGVGHANHGALLAPLHTTSSTTVAAGSAGSKSIIHCDARFWDVKRSMFDASGEQQPHARKKRGHTSPPKIAARQNASVLSPVATTKTQDIVSPDHLFRKKATFAAVKNVLASSVRQLPTAVAASSSTLLLGSVLESAASNNSNNTFLTEATLTTGADNNAELLNSSSNATESQSSDITTNANATTTTGGTMRVSPATRDLMLEHWGDGPSSLATAFGLPAHFQDYPQSEWDVKRSYNYDVVLKLQTLSDAMKTEVARKQATVALLKQAIDDTTHRYALAARECAMAKHAIAEMTARMDTIERLTSAVERQDKSHRKLLTRACERFPATVPSHLDSVQRALKLLQMQLKDLHEERKVLGVKRAHLLSVELPLMRAATDKSKALLSAVVDRLVRARAKASHDQAETDKLFARRLEMLESVRSASFDSDNALSDDVAAAGAAAGSAGLSQAASAPPTTRSLAATAALQQCDAMCEKIQKATGSKLELILQKFLSRDELNTSFEEQAKVYEARLKQIKLHERELAAQLQSLEMSNASAVTDDPRVLEERLRIAELELARTERTQSSLLTTSKEVIAGASRIVKLMGITSCRSPYAHAIPANCLWPPPLGIDGDNSLSTEFETLAPQAIASLLLVCQDRASLMIDAIEGGRGDPDANFAVVQMDASNKQQRASKGPRGSNDEKLGVRASGRIKRPSGGAGGGNGGASDKRDRSFDRGSVPSIVYPSGGGGTTLSSGSSSGNSSGVGVFVLESMPTQSLGLPDTIDEDESGADPATRESVKASSRSKLVAKKRVGPSAAHHVAHGSSGAT